MRLIAIRQLVGDYGRVADGQQFEAPEDVAKQLLARGLARRADPPEVLYRAIGRRIVSEEEFERKRNQ